MKIIMKSMNRRAPARCGAVMSILSIALAAQAQTASEPLADFGSLGQGNAGVTVVNGLNIQYNACAPTAVANGLTFLQNYFAAPIFSQNVNSYATVNALATAMGTANNNYWVYKNITTGRLSYYNANVNPQNVPAAPAGTVYVKTLYNVGGTSAQNIYNGVGTYLRTVNPTGGGPSVSYGQQFNPTATTLYNDLNADDAVEVGILWGTNTVATPNNPSIVKASGGGHFVTLESITMNGNSGTMKIIDPWGASTPAGGPGSTANLVTLNYTVQGGVLAITGTFGNDADTIGRMFGGAGSAMSGLLTLDDIQTVPANTPVAVPEPSTYLAGALLLLPFGASTLRKLRKAGCTA